MEFTVIRDSLNTASRFSGLAQTRPARPERLGAQFEVRQHPSTRVRGKAEEVEVFEVVC